MDYGMTKEKWESLKKLKAPKPQLLWDSGKRMLFKGIWTKGRTYRKVEHGLLTIKPKEQK